MEGIAVAKAADRRHRGVELTRRARERWLVAGRLSDLSLLALYYIKPAGVAGIFSIKPLEGDTLTLQPATIEVTPSGLAPSTRRNADAS